MFHVEVALMHLHPLVHWQTKGVKSVELSGAQPKFLEICRRVAKSGNAILVTHDGKPMVRIAPVSAPPKKAVWHSRATYLKNAGPLTEDLQMPKREQQTWRDPLV